MCAPGGTEQQPGLYPQTPAAAVIRDKYNVSRHGHRPLEGLITPHPWLRSPGLKEDIFPPLSPDALLAGHPVGCHLGDIIWSTLTQWRVPPQMPPPGGWKQRSRLYQTVKEHGDPQEGVSCHLCFWSQFHGMRQCQAPKAGDKIVRKWSQSCTYPWRSFFGGTLGKLRLETLSQNCTSPESISKPHFYEARRASVMERTLHPSGI